MNFLAFGANFISSWILIRIRNADPDPGDKSNADPDPKHCYYEYVCIYSMFAGMYVGSVTDTGLF
jgi:hypothetical protein